MPFKDIPLPSMFANERQLPESEFAEAAKYEAVVPAGVEISKVTRGKSGTSRDASDEVVGALHATDARIARLDGDLQRQPDFQSPSGTSEYDYQVMVGNPVAEKLQAFLAEKGIDPKDVLVRTTPLSINGSLASAEEGIVIRDVRDVCVRGTDRYPDDATTVAGFGYLNDQGNVELHTHVNAAAANTALFRSKMEGKFSPERIDAIFPVLLVYDRKMLKSGGSYGHLLPTDPEEKKKAVLAAFIMPILER